MVIADLCVGLLFRGGEGFYGSEERGSGWVAIFEAWNRDVV